MNLYWTQLAQKALKIEGKEPRTFGHLNAVFMNPENGQIIAYLVGMGRVLSPADLETVEQDRIYITGVEAFVSAHDLIRLEEFGFKKCLLNLKKVQSRKGRSFGRVRDFLLDPTTSAITKLVVSRGFLGFQWKHRIFTWQDIYEVTETAIILKHEPEERKKIKLTAPAPHPG